MAPKIHVQEEKAPRDFTRKFSNPEVWEASEMKEATYEQILFSQINRCLVNGSIEWHGGFWQEKETKMGQAVLTYVPDTRQTFVNSVEMLGAMLTPRHDDKFTEEVKTVGSTIEDLHKKVRELGTRDNPLFDLHYNDLADKYREVFGFCMNLIKRLGLLKASVQSI